MSKPNQTPKTRHLFPEAAAWFIMGQRGLLRVRWALREDQDWFPAWSIGAIAGVCGVMLAVLLLFLEERPLVAAPSVTAAEEALAEDILPEPETNVVPVLSRQFDGVFPDLSNDRPDLNFSEVLRTDLPFFWDQNEVAVIHSRAKRIEERFIKDDWTRATPDFAIANQFRPYLLQGATIPATPSYLTSSGQRTLFDGVEETRIQGVFVEKHSLPTTAIGEPYTYVIHVINKSNDVIDEVYVHEKISVIHRVAQVEPPASIQGDELVWAVGKLPVKGRKAFRVTLTPDTAKSIQTVTRLANKSKVGGIAKVSEPAPLEPELLPVEPEEIVPILQKPAPIELPVSELPKPFPELKLSVTPVNVLRKGETLSLNFQVSNVGTAAAENVTLYVYLSDQFKHKYGERVKHTITKLEPGQSRTALFQARAKEVGTGQLSASLQMAGAEKRSENLKIKIEPDQKTMSNRSNSTQFVEIKKPNTRSTETEKLVQSESVPIQWEKFSE